VTLLALAFACRETYHLRAGSLETVPLLLLSALLLPLFPLHGLYVASLTRAPRTLAPVLSIVLPAVALFLIPKMPQELLPAVGVLAAFGALWGSMKALVQDRVSHLLAYAGLALYSVLWWHIAKIGKVTPHAIAYAAAVSLVICGLALAWNRLRVRYGDLDLNRIGGLFKPMPHFSLCVALLIMAGVGLPPFGLFFGYVGILLSPSTGMSFGLFAIVAAWFAASWYLFKLMQRLLFGPCRTDLRYEDIGPAEIAAFVVVIGLLVVPGSIPQQWLGPGFTEVTWINGGSR
jgi:NADH-quinone oxidoreductase subunit M